MANWLLASTIAFPFSEMEEAVGFPDWIVWDLITDTMDAICDGFFWDTYCEIFDFICPMGENSGVGVGSGVMTGIFDPVPGFVVVTLRFFSIAMTLGFERCPESDNIERVLCISLIASEAGIRIPRQHVTQRAEITIVNNFTFISTNSRHTRT